MVNKRKIIKRKIIVLERRNYDIKKEERNVGVKYNKKF